MRRSTKTQIQKIAFFFALIVLGIIVQLFLSARAFQPDRVVVWVFDVGQGDAIFIDSKKAQVLIDGGYGDAVLEKLGRVMPFWDRSIDVVINTHPHADHVEGLVAVLDQYDVGEVWVTGQGYDSLLSERFLDLADQKVRFVQRGDAISLHEFAELSVVFPFQSLKQQELDDPNAGSITLLFEYLEGDMLFTGDIGLEEEERILDVIGDVDVLKVAHHGSATSTGQRFLSAVTPEISLISVGENSYGHPHATVMERLAQFSDVILRTDLHGDLRVLFDGGEPQVATFDF